MSVEICHKRKGEFMSVVSLGLSLFLSFSCHILLFFFSSSERYSFKYEEFSVCLFIYLSVCLSFVVYLPTSAKFTPLYCHHIRSKVSDRLSRIIFGH